MRPTPLGRFRDLIASERAVGMVEASLVIPFLALLVIGTVDLARYSAFRLGLQQAVNRGLEMAMMGGPDTAADAIKQETVTQSGADPDDVVVTRRLECNGVETDYATTCTAGVESARYTTISVTMAFTPTFEFGVLQGLVNDSGQISVTTTGEIRNQ